MISFKTHYLFEDKLTGSARLVFSMGLENIERYHEKDLPNIASAEAYLNDTKRTWLLNCLEKFINHKKLIWLNVPNNQNQLQNWNSCYKAYNDFFDKPLKTICQRVLVGEQFLKNILPSPNNDSHQSSVNNLEMIINFCKEETK